MSEREQNPEHEGAAAAEPGLDELRDRLNALQRSVEQLGTEGASYAAPPEFSVPQPPPAPEGQGAYVPAPPPAPAGPETRTPAPPTPPAAPSPPPPAPAATNGRGDESAGFAGAASVAYVDVGPFAGLVALRRFEDAVGSLPSVRDVRVRRVAGGRAQVEVWMVGPQSLPRELQRLGAPLRVEPGPEGQIVVELEPAEQPEAEPGSGVPAAGEDGG